jgi:hypothetical protein
MINRTPRTRMRRIPVLAAAVAASMSGAAAFGQTVVSWTGAPGSALDYNTGANWSSGLTPSNAANEFHVINNGGTAAVSGTQTAETANHHLGLEPNHSGRLENSGATLNLAEL